MSNVSFRWVFFSIAALLLAWRIVSVNVAQHLASDDNPAAASWISNVPGVLLLQAAQAVGSDPAKARQLALQAAWENPADGRAFLILALLWEQEGKLELAKKAISAVDFLTPRKAENQLQIAHFWARQGDMMRALPHWSVAMQMNPDLTQNLFPELLRIAEIPRYRPAFSKVLASPPDWVDNFFLYALNNAIDPNTVKSIYLSLENSAKRPGQAIRKAYLDRLMRDRMWTEAYFVWMNSLDSNQVSALGNIDDGGFEQEPTEGGYGWQLANDNSFAVETKPTYGASGEKALSIEFTGSRPATSTPVSQFLMLDPGQYKMTGKVRIDILKAIKGLRWIVSCASSTGEILAESEYFNGKAPWRQFSATLKVPEVGCEAQKIELVMDSADTARSDMSGSIWFDDLAISLLR
jgi:tetratricopeptide (TPR) repeat protein